MSTTPHVQLRRVGDRGWLGNTPIGAPGDWSRTLRVQPWADLLLEDVVPSDASVLVTARPGVDMEDLYRRLMAVPIVADAVPPQFRNAVSQSGPRTLNIRVRYDGCDLSDVAHRLGLTTHQVVQLHTSATYTVGFFGFAPGFAYLGGLAETLQLPRRADPRIHVDAGAVAIADRYTVIYPGHTPGGWHIIGTTTEQLWNPEAEPPNQLNVGDRIRFEEAP